MILSQLHQIAIFAAAQSPIKDPSSLPHVDGGQGSIQIILSIVFGIIGSLSVLMIVISGLKYITSSGDPQKASEAKSGIMYALIGLAIAILAQAIVVFVVKRVGA